MSDVGGGRFDPRKRTYFGVHAGHDPGWGKARGRGSTRVGHAPGQNPTVAPRTMVFGHVAQSRAGAGASAGTVTVTVPLPRTPHLC